MATHHKLTTNEKWEIGVAVGLVILLLLLAYANGAQQPAGAQNNVQSPTNPGIAPLDTWTPDTSPVNINGGTFPISVEAPSQYNVGNGTSCSCGCNNQASFGSLAQMEQTYINDYNQSVSSLFASSLGALPSWVSQYVNNLTGWAESLTADNALQ